MLHLERRGDLRNLIGFVERWTEVGEPTEPARLAEARAFVSLCLMDRAWIRLKELTENGGGRPEAHLLTARMFIERGWPARAKKPLDLALKDGDEKLRRDAEPLRLRLQEPPPVLPDEEPEGPPELLLTLAERWLSSGSFLKAQRVLEKLHRRTPENDRVGDLLWALQGDFRLSGTLAELAARLGPDGAQLADLSDDPEHTESVTREGLDESATEEEHGEAFPSLFRADTPPLVPRDESTDEVTQASALVSLDMLRMAAGPGNDDVHADVGGDTQIVRVLHSGREAATGPMHKPMEETDGVFDLAKFRAEMGMTSTGGDFDTGPEAEDDDRIVVTRTERASEPDEPSNSGVESIEPDTTTSEVRRDSLRRSQLEAIEAKAYAAMPAPVEKPREFSPGGARGESPPKESKSPAARPSDKPRAKPRRSSASSSVPWLLALVVLLLVSIGVVSVFFLHLIATTH